MRVPSGNAGVDPREALQADRLEVARARCVDCEGCGTSPSLSWRKVASGSPASNGGVPVSNSYRIAPRP